MKHAESLPIFCGGLGGHSGVDRLPELAARPFGGGRDVLDRARVGRITGRASDMGKGDVNCRRKPVEPFGAARLLPRIPWPKPGGRMARRDITQNCRGLDLV